MAKVRELRTREEIRPVAAPVRTGYTSRDVPSTSASMQLAEALAGLQPSLNRFFTKKAEEQQQQDTAKGASLYELQANRESWADFVKKNPEYAKANPWVKEGYLRARMANEGDNYRLWLQAQASGENAFLEVDGQKIPLSEANPDQTALWMQQQKQRYVQEKMGGVADPSLFSEIFLPLSGNAERELSSRIMSYQQDVMWNKAIGEHTTLMVNTLRGALEAGAFDGPEAEQAYTHLGAQITGMARELIKDGVPPQQVNSAIVNALIGLAEDDAIQDGDTILDIVNHIETSKGSFLGNIPEVKRTIEQAKDAIVQENYYKIMREEQLRQMAEEKAQREDDIKIALAYLDNPLNVPKGVRKDYIKKYGLTGYTQLINRLGTVDSYNEAPRGTGGGEERAAVNMWYRVAMGDIPSPQEVINAGMSKSETVSLLRTVASKSEDDIRAAQQFGPLIENDVYKTLFGTKDNLDDAEEIVALQIAEEAAVVMQELVKNDPSLLQNPQRLRLETKRVTTETTDKYKDRVGNAIYRATTDRRASIKDTGGQGFNILAGIPQEKHESVRAMAREYTAKRDAGEDVGDTRFARLVVGLSKKTGRKLTPEEVLESLSKGGKQ